MKKRLLCFTVIIALLFSFSACDKTEKVQNEEKIFPRYDTYASKELDGGWFLYGDYQEIYTPEGKPAEGCCFYLEGVNLKYRNLKDFAIPVIDDATGEISHYITPNVFAMGTNNEYEVIFEKLGKYLTERKQSPDLTVEELSFIEIEDKLFTKDDVVYLYNTVFENYKPRNEENNIMRGKYKNISYDQLQRGPELNGYSWQAGYLINSNGNIDKLNIELIYSDGQYLSNIEEASLTEGQRELL